MFLLIGKTHRMEFKTLQYFTGDRPVGFSLCGQPMNGHSSFSYFSFFGQETKFQENPNFVPRPGNVERMVSLRTYEKNFKAAKKGKRGKGSISLLNSIFSWICYSYFYYSYSLGMSICFLYIFQAFLTRPPPDLLWKNRGRIQFLQISRYQLQKY